MKEGSLIRFTAGNLNHDDLSTLAEQIVAFEKDGQIAKPRSAKTAKERIEICRRLPDRSIAILLLQLRYATEIDRIIADELEAIGARSELALRGYGTIALMNQLGTCPNLEFVLSVCSAKGDHIHTDAFEILRSITVGSDDRLENSA